MSKEEKTPEPFKPHPNLNEEYNQAIVESELLGGAWLEKLRVGGKLEMITLNHTYIIERREDGFYISGHPKFCPEPTKAEIHGSTWGKSSSIKVKFVGRGMNLEFKLAKQGPFEVIRTSPIKEVREIQE